MFIRHTRRGKHDLIIKVLTYQRLCSIFWKPTESPVTPCILHCLLWDTLTWFNCLHLFSFWWCCCAIIDCFLLGWSHWSLMYWLFLYQPWLPLVSELILNKGLGYSNIQRLPKASASFWNMLHFNSYFVNPRYDQSHHVAPVMLWLVWCWCIWRCSISESCNTNSPKSSTLSPANAMNFLCFLWPRFLRFLLEFSFSLFYNFISSQTNSRYSCPTLQYVPDGLTLCWLQYCGKS